MTLISRKQASRPIQALGQNASRGQGHPKLKAIISIQG